MVTEPPPPPRTVMTLSSFATWACATYVPTLYARSWAPWLRLMITIILVVVIIRIDLVALPHS